MMEKTPSFQGRIFHIIQKEKWERTFIISIVYGCICQKACRRYCGMDMWMDKVDVLLTSLGYSVIFVWLDITSMMHIYVRITMHINNTYKYIWVSFCWEVAHMVHVRGEIRAPLETACMHAIHGEMCIEKVSSMIGYWTKNKNQPDRIITINHGSSVLKV